MINRQQPGIWSCGVGTVAGIVVWVVVSFAILFMGPLLGIVFDVVLFVPEQLGVIDRLGKNEKIEVAIPGEYEVKLGRVGVYHVYCAKEEWPPFTITLSSKTVGEQIEVRPVQHYWDNNSAINKPVAPYSLGDSYLPRYEFDVNQAGLYNISVTAKSERSRDQKIWIAPSIPPTSDLVLISSILVQGLLVLGLLRLIYYQRHRTEIQAAKAARSEKSDKFSAWMDERQDEN